MDNGIEVKKCKNCNYNFSIFATASHFWADKDKDYCAFCNDAKDLDTGKKILYALNVLTDYISSLEDEIDRC